VASKRVGLTGNIGSGKSTVAWLFVRRGAALIDADLLARQATEDPTVLAEIARVLGPELVGEKGLDRQRTAELVFRDPKALDSLNGIIHPWVRRRSAERVAALRRRPHPPEVILQDIPLLYENHLDRGLDAVIVVEAPLELRIERVVARSGLSEAEVRARDASQMPLADKVERADYVIHNGGTPAELEAQVEAVWKTLTS